MQSTTILPTKDEFKAFHTAVDWLRSVCKHKCESCFISAHLNSDEDCPVSTLDSADRRLLDNIIDAALAQPLRTKQMGEKS